MNKRPGPHNKEKKRVGDAPDTIEVKRNSVFRAGVLMPVGRMMRVGDFGIIIDQMPSKKPIISCYELGKSGRKNWVKQNVTEGTYEPTEKRLIRVEHSDTNVTSDEQATTIMERFHQLLVAFEVDEEEAKRLAKSVGGSIMQLPKFAIILIRICEIGEEEKHEEKKGEEGKPRLSDVLVELTSCGSIEDVCEVLNILQEDLGNYIGKAQRLVVCVKTRADELWMLVA